MTELLFQLLNSLDGQITVGISAFIGICFTITVLNEIWDKRKELIEWKRVNNNFRSITENSDENSLSDELKKIKQHYFSPLRSSDGTVLLRMLPHVFSGPPKPSKRRYMIVVLSSVGVIGTFCGIVVGLSGFDEATVRGGADEMLTSIMTLLGGMQTAFWTSLVGMSGSVMLSLFINWQEKARRINHKAVSDKFFDQFRLETLADFLDQLSGQNQEQLAKKQLIAAHKSAQASETLLKMGTSLEKAAQNFDADKIGEHISGSLQTIFATEMVPVFKDISRELEELRAIKQDNGEKVIQAIMAQLRSEVIQPLATQIKETSGLVQESTKAVYSLQEELGDIATKLASAVSTIQTFQEETLGRLSEFAQKLQGILGGFQNDTKVILQGVADQLDSAVQKSLSAMNAQKEAFEQSVQHAAGTFKGIRTEFEQSLDKHAKVQKEMLDDTGRRVEGILDQSAKSYQAQLESMEQVGKAASDLIDSSRNNLELTLKNVEQVLVRTRKTVEEELEKFREDYQTSLTMFFTEQNNLLENTLGEQRDGIASVVEQCSGVFKEEYERRLELGVKLSGHLDELQNTVDIINKLTQATQMLDAAHFNQIEQTANAIGRQVGRLEKSYQTTSELFGNLLKQVPDALNQYFERANTTHNEYFTEMDKASAKIHNRLLQSAEYLISGEHQRRIMDEDGANS
ncbi:hypothetical protein [Endozoicomonas lisbonensis]|uniref:Uncharacterized protein YukE n=1 Tax=Endozoicomonas lisbonensis TaxID=3120522 RepID=A0ABV2SNQ5_9GAMM